MSKLSRGFWKFVLLLIGWRVLNPQEFERRSVVAVAPHTSYLDGVIGYIAMKALGVNFKVISAEWLFFFPFKYVMKYVMHAIPCGRKSGNSIRVATRLFKEEKDVNLIICPEGQLAATDSWNKGFHTIAKIADVPFQFAIFDYEEKVIWFSKSHESKDEWSDADDALEHLSGIIANGGGSARHPEKFLKHKRKSREGK